MEDDKGGRGENRPPNTKYARLLSNWTWAGVLGRVYIVSIYNFFLKLRTHLVRLPSREDRHPCLVVQVAVAFATGGGGQKTWLAVSYLPTAWVIPPKKPLGMDLGLYGVVGVKQSPIILIIISKYDEWSWVWLTHLLLLKPPHQLHRAQPWWTG